MKFVSRLTLLGLGAVAVLTLIASRADPRYSLVMALLIFGVTALVSILNIVYLHKHPVTELEGGSGSPGTGHPAQGSDERGELSG